MQTSVLQLIALTCYGNAIIRGFKLPQFFPNHSTCGKFVASMKFVETIESKYGDTSESIISDTPDQWFTRLLEHEAIGLRLISIATMSSLPDRIAISFAGETGNLLIEVMLKNGMSEFWMSRWTVLEVASSWQITFYRVKTAATMQYQFPSLQDVHTRLQHALLEILNFSKQQNCKGFTARFANALQALNEPCTEIEHYPDLFIAGTLPEAAVRILNAVKKAWVFGGMGSWNDLGFLSGMIQQEYTRVSDNLFRVVTEAIAVAASSSMQKPD